MIERDPVIREEGAYLASLLTLAASLPVMALILWILSRSVTFQVDWDLIHRIVAYQRAGDIRPEPLEQFLYLSGILLLPICLAAFFILLTRSGLPERIAASPSYPAIRPLVHFMPLVLALGGFLGLVVPRVWGSVWWRVMGLPSALAATVALPLFLYLSRFPAGSGIGDRWRFLIPLAANAAAGPVLLGVFLSCLFDLAQVNYTDVYGVSFEAFFFPVVQVFEGKELLVNATSL
jgi:hypothetical protein